MNSAYIHRTHSKTTLFFVSIFKMTSLHPCKQSFHFLPVEEILCILSIEVQQESQHPAPYLGSSCCRQRTSDIFSVMCSYLYITKNYGNFLINNKSRDNSLNIQIWLLISGVIVLAVKHYFSVLPKNPIYHIVAYCIWNANTNYPIFFLLFRKWFLKLYLQVVINHKEHVNRFTFQQMCSFCDLIILKPSFFPSWMGSCHFKGGSIYFPD